MDFACHSTFPWKFATSQLECRVHPFAPAGQRWSLHHGGTEGTEKSEQKEKELRVLRVSVVNLSCSVEGPSCWSVFPARSFRESGGSPWSPQSFPTSKKQAWKSSSKPARASRRAIRMQSTPPRGLPLLPSAARCSARQTSSCRCCVTARTM